MKKILDGFIISGLLITVGYIIGSEYQKDKDEPKIARAYFDGWCAGAIDLIKIHSN